jgi:hypothetical protein
MMRILKLDLRPPCVPAVIDPLAAMLIGMCGITVMEM